MSLIKAFRGLRPQPQFAAAVAAPPYDVLSSSEAASLAQNKPWSFLHISRPEIDLPDGTDIYSPLVYAQATHNLQHMLTQEVLLRETTPCFYHYRLQMGTHVQDGLVAAASVAAYESNRIRKHEFTRPDKEDDRVRQITALNAQTGPVLLAYPAAPDIDYLLAQAGTALTPLYDITGVGLEGAATVRHSLRKIEDSVLIARLIQAFDALPALYIADGHHRSAAAARVAATRRTSQQTGAESAETFLSVIFPHHQMRIFDYNRVVRDLNGLSVADFLQKVAVNYTIVPQDNAHAPQTHGDIGLYLADHWYQLRIKPQFVPSADPVACLDVSLLSDFILAPILNITDLRRDKRIDFIGGIRGLSELERRVDSGEMAAAFAMYPTSMAQLMAVADTGSVMPPKSTWFEPKLADGLVSHVLD